MTGNLNKKIGNAIKWSTLSEVIVKLILPIINMVLARLLTPEMFGVVTTLTMITSFAGLFTDAGFYKFIIQHEFEDESDCIQCANVAFWSNFTMSILIWGVLAFFAEPLANIVGSPGLGHVLVIASLSIPISSLTSIQSALFNRNFEFKLLFKLRLVSVLIPLVTTIPLAIWLRSYWALVLGGLLNSIVGAILIAKYSNWKPSFSYSFPKLRKMLSFSIYSQLESISIWLTLYVDVFIVGTMLSSYYLGLYKAASTVVGSITRMITAATTPVLFASLSRLQNNKEEFDHLFFKFQKFVGLLVIPIGVSIFCYSDLITAILLGSQWMEASGFVGLWGLTSGFAIIFSHYSSEIYRAKGRPKLSVLSQWLIILVLWPVVLVAVQYGYETLYISRAAVRLYSIMVNLCILSILVRFPVWKMIRNIIPAVVASLSIIIVSFCIRMICDSYLCQFLSMALCMFIYFVIIYRFPTEHILIDTFILEKVRKRLSTVVCAHAK